MPWIRRNSLILKHRKNAMKLLRITIKSLSPGMLQNPATPELLEALRTKTPQTKRLDWTVDVEAGTKLYRSEPDGDKPGKMGIPAQNMLACLVNAGRHVKSGKKQISTATSTTLFDFVELTETFLPFDGTDDKGNVVWKPCVVKGTMHAAQKETAVCIVRPRIMHWTMTVTLRFDDSRGVNQDVVVELFKQGGRKVGLGDWRPQKRGNFGRFVVTKVESVTIPNTDAVIENVEYKTADEAPADLRAMIEPRAA